MELVLLLIMLLALGFIKSLLEKQKYDKSQYKKESGNKYIQVRFNSGNYGEYLTFLKLEKIKGNHKILTNVYIPKENGETTEIDLVYIHETGIYVLESKNYSGWIFGSENNKYWTQSFKTGRKEIFYNPILQNKTHIRYLSKALNLDEKHMKSIIVFSERCTLKKIEVTSQNVRVINRYNLVKQIEKLIKNSDKIFEEKEINEMYYNLKKYTLMTDEVKEKHINNINSKRDFPGNREKKVDLKVNKENEVKIRKSNNDDKLYEELKEYRLNKSREENIKAYRIFNNSEMERIIEVKPQTIEEFKNVQGFGKIKCEKYGYDIINIIKKY